MQSSEKVAEKIAEWRSRLLDLTKRNRLINCKIGPRAALEFLHPSPEMIWDHLSVREVPLRFAAKSELVGQTTRIAPSTEENLGEGFSGDRPAETAAETQRISIETCLQSRYLRPDHILTELTDAKLTSRLKRLALTAKTSLDEQGVNILFVAFGLLQWYEAPQSEIPILSPLLLVPVTLTRPGLDEAWSLGTYESETVENQCLREMLKLSFRFELPTYSDRESDENPSDPFEYFERIRRFLSERKAADRWQVLPQVIFGAFSFQKIAMWEDLKKNADRISVHPVCRGVAGDPIGTSPDNDGVPPSEFDNRIQPRDIHSVLDSDSSQLETVLAAKRGISLIVDGPPGTGKSQTIANIIAECLADQKTVLFVSEKSAALEVVKRRLDDQRLGDFCLECHSHKANKKQVLAELNRSLELPEESYRDQSALLSELYDCRQRLNAYVQALHQRRGALQISVFQAHGRLAGLKPTRQTMASVPDPKGITESELRSILRLLQSLEKRANVLSDTKNHPWNGAIPSSFSLTLGEEIGRTLVTMASVLESLVPSIAILAGHSVISPDPRLRDLGEAVLRIREIAKHPMFPSSWFSPNPAALVRTVQSLHAAEQTLHQLRQETPAIQPNAPSISPHIRNLILTWRDREPFSRVRIDSWCSFRQFQRHIEAVKTEIGRLRHGIVTLRANTAAFSRQMQVKIDENSSLNVLNKLARLGSMIVDIGPLRLAWFDPARRRDLLRVQATCRHEAEVRNEIRVKYGAVWTAVAFNREGQEAAESSLEFESAWVRIRSTLNGRWGAFQRKVKSLYLDRMPKTTELLSDMHELRRFHRCANSVRRVEEEFGAELVFDAAGDIDWDALQHGIEGIDCLQSLMNKIPDKLKQNLCTDGRIDRNGLGTATGALKNGLTTVQQLMERLNENFSLHQPVDPRRSCEDLPSLELEKWLDAMARAFQKYGDELREFELCLKPNTDVSLADLPKLFDRLDAQATQAQTIAQTRRTLVDVPGISCPCIADGDLRKDDLDAIQALSQILATFGDNLATPLVRLLTNSAARDEVAQGSLVVEVAIRELKPLLARLAQTFPLDRPVSTNVTIGQLGIGELAQWLRRQYGSLNQLEEWIDFRNLEEALRERKLGEIITELAQPDMPKVGLQDVFLARFFRQWLDAVYSSDPILRNFRLDEHEGDLESFRARDRDSIDGAYKRIRAKLLQDPDRPHSAMLNAPPTSELGILLRECARKRPRLPLRQLFAKIPTILRRLKPCMMMSPLAVSTFLDSPELVFDVVIFDEASQVRPFDAIGAIYRGKQLVVAGDQKQLPPTAFFDRIDAGDESDEAEDDEESASIGEFESILDVCCSLGMPRKRLRWHYRSRRESLIAFSNRFFYDNELITFPSVYDVEGCSAVTHHFVQTGRWISGPSGGFNLVEAQETAALVIDHFQRLPERSLGVITLNQRQQFAVIDELDKLRRTRPELAALFDDARREPFFVKNLENVQGDERDHILLSVAYGPDNSGKFAMRFGPLNQEGGERRLNVAVTRARYATVVVSSIRAEDIDLSRAKAVGAMLLRNYLDFAARGVSAIAAATTVSPNAEHDSEFEAEVERALVAQGLIVHRQVGCGGFRIDLAVVHPERSGRFVLGIECDGATYHSSATARDRDRLRQEVLEGLGWTIIRIWSTDWVRNPSRQIERVIQAYREQISTSPIEADSTPLLGEKNDDVDESIEQPILRIRRDTDTEEFQRYQNIDEVSDREIQMVVLELLQKYGPTTRSDLMRAVTRQFGFQRMGRRIQQRIDGVIEQMAAQRKLRWGEEGALSAC